jgi:hypothetical protein
LILLHCTDTVYNMLILLHCTDTVYNMLILLHCTDAVCNMLILLHCTDTVYNMLMCISSVNFDTGLDISIVPSCIFMVYWLFLFDYIKII